MCARSLLLVVMLSVLAGCAVQRVTFNEIEYTAHQKSGDKAVTGKAFLTDQLNQTQYGSGSEVLLEPVTSYSDQWYEVSYENNRLLSSPDPRYKQYVKKTKADKEGNFTFKDVVPGEYYLTSQVKWRAATCSGNVVYKKIPISLKIFVVADQPQTEVLLTKPFVSPTDICKFYNQSDWVRE